MRNRIKNKTLDYIEKEDNSTKMAGGNSTKENNSDEIVKEYNSSLMDLTINSKPLINMLTLLAEDYIDHANAIVEAIEAHLQKVNSEIKLPVLYLIDSIVKNVNRAYLSLFTKNIVNTFCSVFEKVDEGTRASMWKLRQTWSEVFPPKKLFALDVKVHNIDPAWPIAPLPVNSVSAAKSIHVNPKFLTMQQHQERAAKTASAAAPTPPSSAKIPAVPTVKSVSTSEAEMREKLLQKQKELIELQKQKVELELLQAKASLEQQRRQLDKQNVQLPTSPDGALEKSAAAISAPSQVLKPIEKQFPAAAASLLKIDSNKSSVKIAPASSIAVASAKPVASRDPRLKMAAPPITKNNLTTEELAKQQQLMQQLQLHMQSKLSGEQKQSSLLNDAAIKTTSESELHSNNKSLDNKRAKDSSSQKKDSSITSTTNVTTSQRSNSIIKDHSKSSSTKSSSSRGSSSSSSSKTSSSSSSRKSGSKSRSKSSSSSSSSPNKIPKLDENSLSSDKRSSSSFSTSSKKSKSRKTHSPSPVPLTTATSNGASSQTSYRIPRRSVAQEATASQAQTLAGSCNNKSTRTSGLDEEEQSGGSLIVSLALPPATTAPTSFKEIRSTTKMRNYVRRNKQGSRSPETIDEAKKDVAMPDASKDEDLRAPIVSVNVAAAGPAAALDTKEDLDLRVLAVPNKRQSSDVLEPANAKKSKAEKFDALFGNEDVDLRTLTNPKAGRPATPTASHIIHEKNKDSWAKLKTPIKSDRDTLKPLSDNRNRDRLGRPRLYNKIGNSSEDQKDGRRIRGPPMSRDLDKHNERNADRNIEIIMKQAAEQLNQGQITKSQYNKLIQDVLHMSEDEKLKAAQRKEQEIGMLVWEKDGPGGAQSFGNDENIRKDHPGMHPRIPGPGGPRWQSPWHQPWAHGPPFPGGPHGFPGGPDNFRPMGPWQNHPRLFGGPMRPDFHPPFHPGGYNPRMGPPPMGPNGPMIMPNGPMNPMGPMNQMGPMGPSMMMGNGPVRSDHAAKRNSPNLTGATAANSGSVNAANVTTAGATLEADKAGLSFMKNCGELPFADPQVIEEIAKDTMKSISIDGISREIRYYGKLGVVFMNWDDPRDIGFQDGTRRIIIDGKDSIVCGFNQDYKEFTYEGEIHRIKLGTPTRELYVDDKWYECYFGGRPIMVDLGDKKVSMSLEGPPPQVKIGNTKRTDLVIGKINLIINARNMVPVFLDAKPQMFEIEDRQLTLEFIDALQTVLLNGRPFKVEFGGLPKPILVGEKKHFIRFSVLPRGFSAGYVKITGMKGEPGKDSAIELAKQLTANKNMDGTSSSTVAKPPTVTNLAQPMDVDTTSQDGTDTISGSKPSLQLDVLSSVVPSAMAPSSGLSYQAEPVENPPAAAQTLALPLNLNALFQRLVETGIVPNLSETKKPEEEEKKEAEIIPVSFDKPETLKIKNTAVVTAIYSGMQCSSCGARFAPEMATRYSHHLDWHFRQNRKERDSARKAHSRPWYYDQSDWIQFEEIEDLEDRAQSWFETEKQTAETDAAATEDSSAEAQQPSVPTGSDETSFCEVCHEAFEQFYNEENEEWHLRPTVAFEEKNYHPLCLEDHKRALEKSALALEESITEMEEEVKDKEENNDEKKDDEEEIHVKVEQEDEGQDEEMQDEDSQEHEEKPIIKTEIEDEDDEQKIKEEGDSDNEEEKPEDMDVDDSEPIEIIEPLPRKIELEEIEDSSDEENEDGTRKERPKITSSEEKIPDDVPLIFENVKVKEEPIDEDDIGDVEESTIAEAAAVDTTQVAVKSSIDGNVELDSAAPTIPAAPSKIKLNITKILVAPKETDESKKEEKKQTESPVEVAPAKPLIPAAIKPSLQGKKLSILPTVEKGHELSGFCSIM